MEEKPSPNDKGEHKPRETVDTKPSGISPSSKKKKKSDSEKSKKDKKSDDKKSKKDKKLDNKKSKKDKKSDKKKSKKGKRTKEEEISDSFGGIPVLRPDQLMDELGKLGVLKKPWQFMWSVAWNKLGCVFYVHLLIPMICTAGPVYMGHSPDT